MSFEYLEKLLNFWHDPRNAPSPETLATIQEVHKKFMEIINQT